MPKSFLFIESVGRVSGALRIKVKRYFFRIFLIASLMYIFQQFGIEILEPLGISILRRLHCSDEKSRSFGELIEPTVIEKLMFFVYDERDNIMA